MRGTEHQNIADLHVAARREAQHTVLIHNPHALDPRRRQLRAVAIASDRLRQSGIAEINVLDVMTAASDGLDRAIGALMQHAPPLLAVHCIGDSSGEAEALAVRWEELR